MVGGSKWPAPRLRRCVFFGFLAAALILCPEAAPARDWGPMKIFGPADQAAAVEECARTFARDYAPGVEIFSGPPDQWLRRAKVSADVLFGGAGFALDEFAGGHSCLVDGASRAEFGGGWPVYATHFVKHEEAARRFIDFLRSPACRPLWTHVED